MIESDNESVAILSSWVIIADLASIFVFLIYNYLYPSTIDLR